jgi:hypothetical protein
LQTHQFKSGYSAEWFAVRENGLAAFDRAAKKGKVSEMAAGQEAVGAGKTGCGPATTLPI